VVTRTKKVFVGGLSAQTTLDDVRGYFEQFGLVSRVNGKPVWLLGELKVSSTG